MKKIKAADDGDSSIPKSVAIKPLIYSNFYTEGPAIDKEGNIYYTTLSGSKIMKISTEGVVSVWAETACPNGQKILVDGDHLVCDSKLGKIIRFDSSGKKIEDVAFGKCEGIAIETPNDLIIDEDSGFYFTDSKRFTGSVFFFHKNGKNNLIATNLDYPNGICLSKDKTKLFISESYKNRILVIDLKEPGSPNGSPQVFCDLPFNDNNSLTGNLPDGILIDDLDRLWVAHYGMQAVQCISSQGVVISSVETGIPLTSNICFTKDNKGLIVTGGSGEPGPGNVHILSLYDS